jgi:WS/DGAT/MGAT family acyltransferase
MALIQLLLNLHDARGNEGDAGVAWAPRSALPAASADLAAAVAHRPRLPAGVRLAGRFASALGRLVVLPPDPHSALDGRLGVRKAAAWCEPFDFAELRAAARACGATLNDVLGAAAAGAIGRYLAARGRVADGLGVRAVVPVNLRPRGDTSLLGNCFGLVFLRLPVGLTDPGRRLARVHAEMMRLKRSAEAGVTYSLLRVFGPAGRAAVKFAVWFLGMKATLVFTDVPGPRETVTLCGVPLTGLLAWVPESGHLSLGVSAVSYAGRVHVGVVADQGLVGDPNELADGFRAALREIVERAPVLQEA